MYRGDIYLANFSDSEGCEQSGLRPVLVIQNDIGNKYSPTVIVAAITSKFTKARIPAHVEVKANHAGLDKNSVILLEQIRTIDKKRIQNADRPIARLNTEDLKRVNDALMVSLGIALV